MLYITKVIGSQASVYDTDDGTLEWFSVQQLRDYKASGFEFIQGTVTVPHELCNFGKNHENIFGNYTILHHGGNRYELLSKSAGKKMKFHLRNEDGRLMICFNVGINTPADGIEGLRNVSK